jgi:ParB family chromosome partitioning protein
LEAGKKAFPACSGETEMTNPKKITLSQSRDISFNKLVLSERNVRRVRAGVSIEELAEDIVNRTLLQSLSVRVCPDREGFYEVQAGGRRYRALELLIKQKRLNKTTPIPCIIREDGILEEDSLAENCQRQALHPLDQFRAFQALREQGLSDEDIAARFFVTPQIVRQRLKLASVSPALLELYADDEMSLDQLMAFSISNDPARQEQVWETVKRGYNDAPYYIKKLLTENDVPAHDRRVRFVGIAAYEAEGGTVLRDLFSQNGDGWITDVALLERLVAAKLTAEAEAIKAEGWKWIQVAQEFPYGHASGLRRIYGAEALLTDEQKSRYDAVQAELEEIEATQEAWSGEPATGKENNWADDADPMLDEVEERIQSLQAELTAFNELVYDPADIARAGVFISVDGDGDLKVERGFVRPEDEAPSAEDGGEQVEDADTFVRDHVEIIHVGKNGETRQVDPVTALSGNEEHTEDEDEALKPLSERLIMELTAHRTLALRDALANDPDIAFLAVLHAMALQTFYRYATDSCLEITAKSSSFPAQGPDLKECPSAKGLENLHEQWGHRLPGEPELLWEFLCDFDTDSRMALFAYCAALTVNAVHEPWNKAQSRRHHADQLACAVSLDMAAAGWKPTTENYLGRVPKARILEAVTEAKGAGMAELIEGLKKGDMAEQAERLLADTNWLPEPLRTPGMADSMPADEQEPAPDTELPEFLTAAE